MTWTELCDDPQYRFLQDLPFKVETDRWGKIVMSPTRNIHGMLQLRIGRTLEEQRPDGVAITECGVTTPEGTKVADVAWISRERLQPQREQAAFAHAPEICVEILSPTSTLPEMLEKQSLYFNAGAGEFWLCEESGTVRFFSPEGELPLSALCPAFPARLDIF